MLEYSLVQDQDSYTIEKITYPPYFFITTISFCCDSPAPSNRNGVEYDQVPEVEGLEHINLKLSRQQA
jgi:hypothetical protein